MNEFPEDQSNLIVAINVSFPHSPGRPNAWRDEEFDGCILMFASGNGHVFCDHSFEQLDPDLQKLLDYYNYYHEGRDAETLRLIPK